MTCPRKEKSDPKYNQKATKAEKKNAKIMWIPKLLNVAMNLKERFQMTSNSANPKACLMHKSSQLPFSKSILGPYTPKSTIPTPSSPSSILGSYIPKSTFTYSPHFPPFHHPSRCVPMMIFLPPSSTHSQVFQPSNPQPCFPPIHYTPLIQKIHNSFFSISQPISFLFLPSY